MKIDWRVPLLLTITYDAEARSGLTADLPIRAIAKTLTAPCSAPRSGHRRHLQDSRGDAEPSM